MSFQPTTDLWLIRHGETEKETRGRCYGATDVALSDLGTKQMGSVALLLRDAELQAVYSSPRTRCLRSAETICSSPSLFVQPIEDFAELNFGDLEGRTYNEIAATQPELYEQWMSRPTEVKFPNGEGFVEMQARVIAAARRLRAKHSGSAFAVVAHGGVNRILLAEALGIENRNIFRIGQRFAAVNLIRYYGDIPSVDLMNGQPQP